MDNTDTVTLMGHHVFAMAHQCHGFGEFQKAIAVNYFEAVCLRHVLHYYYMELQNALYLKRETLCGDSDEPRSDKKLFSTSKMIFISSKYF